MAMREFTGKTVEEALTSATIELGVTSDRLNYEIIEKGKAGIFGIGGKNAVIRVSIKEEEPAPASKTWEPVVEKSVSEPTPVSTSREKEIVSEKTGSIVEKESEELEPIDGDEAIALAKEFLSSVFHAMGLEVELEVDFDEENLMLSIEMSGPEMGIIIGKRGQTLDSLQYLTNLAVNRKLPSYVRVKMDTEDYRRRRKATLENLARNVAYKVKRTMRPISLEPMNPYERRVIHYALQHDSYVKTESEGEEPYRHVVVSLKEK
ncbi:MAG: protein jag [Lachnospiraceae bacterium]|nr:protein jag [Lachnospiraceae bacterium]